MIKAQQLPWLVLVSGLITTGLIQNCLRESDSLCRLGGDEFVLLIPNAERLEHLLELAERLQNSLRMPFREIAQVEVRISASFGIARWPDHAADADQLLHIADETMYRAKAMADHNIAVANAPGDVLLRENPQHAALPEAQA